MTGVLLHVVEASLPGYLPYQVSEALIRCDLVGENVYDRSSTGAIGLTFNHVQNRHVPQCASVRWLSTRCGIEGGAIKDHRRVVLPSQLLDDMGGEMGPIGVGVVKAFRHCTSRGSLNVNWLPSPGVLSTQISPP